MQIFQLFWIHLAGRIIHQALRLLVFGEGNHIAETAGPELVRDVLGEFVESDVAAAETVEAAVDELLADLACYPSITGNTSLTEGSVLDLLDRLDDCENPYACPHGRPVVIEIDTEELEARFERDYPGH